DSTHFILFAYSICGIGGNHTTSDNQLDTWLVSLLCALNYIFWLVLHVSFLLSYLTISNGARVDAVMRTVDKRSFNRAKEGNDGSHFFCLSAAFEFHIRSFFIKKRLNGFIF